MLSSGDSTTKHARSCDLESVNGCKEGSQADARACGSGKHDRALFRDLVHSFRGRIAELFIRRRSGRGGMIDYVRFQDGIQSTSESTIGR